MIRSKKTGFFLTAAAIAVVVGFVAGPKSSDEGECLFCGRTRYEAWWFGVKIVDRIREHEWSSWVDNIHPAHSNHVWSTSSFSRKPWFGHKMIACGGVGGVANIHYAEKRIGEAKARQLLEAYHWQLKTNRASLRNFILTEMNALFPADGGTNLHQP